MSERQTLTFLSRTLERAGLQPKTKYGQNFLIDLNLLNILIDGAELNQRDVVLEIGTGLGSLTKTMAMKAGAIVTVEVDRDLQALATKELKPYPNVRLLSCDALRNKNHLRSEVLDSVREGLSRIEGSKFKLVANLPYNVATPISEQPDDGNAVGRADGRNDSEGVGRADHRKAFLQGLFRVIGVDAGVG